MRALPLPKAGRLKKPSKLERSGFYNISRNLVEEHGCYLFLASDTDYGRRQELLDELDELSLFNTSQPPGKESSELIFQLIVRWSLLEGGQLCLVG